MQIIVLTSKDNHITTTELDEFLPKPLSESKILCITTALKKSSNLNYVKQQQQILNSLNSSCSNCDISGKSKKELTKILSNVDVVYVTGGSAFYLLKCIKESGFEDVVKNLLPKGLIYIGLSAGAYVACPSILMKTWSKRNSNRFGITDLTAMNLVPFLLKAHYSSDMKETLEAKAKNLKLPLRALNNNQALVITDETIQLIGGGDEIIM